MELYNSISKTLSEKGINLIVGNIYDLMSIWKQWYRGSVNDFHYYKEKINGKTVTCERLTMNMPKKVCEDITKLLWTEKTKIELSNAKATQRLWEVLDSKENSFTVNFPIFLEKVLALGTGATVEYKDELGKIIIDYIDGDVIIPYKYTNSYISAIVVISRFVEEKENNKTYYTHITYHEFSNDEYKKYNELYTSDNETELGKEIDFSSKFPNIKPLEIIKTKNPHFQIYKPNLANNFDTDSPLGISILANSIDRFKALDSKYDSFNNEFILGKKRIIVAQSTLKGGIETDSDGNTRFVQYFDEKDRVYQALNIDAERMTAPVKEIDMKLRYLEHIESINAELNWLSENIGLGGNYYKFDGDGVKTATEVVSENSKAFRTRVHYLSVINDAVYDLVQAICELEGIKTNKITIIPDDSIIEDKNAEQIRAQQEVTAGLRSKLSYLTEIKGMSEEEAEKELQRIQEEKMSTNEALGMLSDEGV